MGGDNFIIMTDNYNTFAVMYCDIMIYLLRYYINYDTILISGYWPNTTNQLCIYGYHCHILHHCQTTVSSWPLLLVHQFISTLETSCMKLYIVINNSNLILLKIALVGVNVCVKVYFWRGLCHVLCHTQSFSFELKYV